MLTIYKKYVVDFSLYDKSAEDISDAFAITKLLESKIGN